jgi:hypothetical protein
LVAPRIARVTLAVTAVKIERLQDISADDCLVEGISPIADEIAKRVEHQHYAGRKRRRSISAAIERVLLREGPTSAASFAYGIASLAVKRSSTTHTSPVRPKKFEWRER